MTELSILFIHRYQEHLSKLNTFLIYLLFVLIYLFISQKMKIKINKINLNFLAK